MHKIRIRLWCNKSFVKFYLPFAFLYSKFSKFTLSYKKNRSYIDICILHVVLKIRMSPMFSTIHIAIEEQKDIYFCKNIIIPWCLEHDAFYCVPAQFLIRMVEFNSKTKKFAILVSWFIISQELMRRFYT